MKEIDIGNETFADFINNDSYYVDKTSLIRTLFKRGTSKVTLITRPRRFGKTLSMSAFHEFLRINPDNPEDTSYQERLFKDTKIFEDREFCREHMGKYPVISITFKEVKGETYARAFKQLKEILCYEIGTNFKYLRSSGKLDDSEKIKLRKLGEESYYTDGAYRKSLDSDKYDGHDDADDIQNSLQSSLRFLTECLCRHHGVKPILLIDEYDVPLDKAATFGYYGKMVPLVSGLLSKALKTNPYLGKAVLTGCLRAAKESIFTGLNNLKVYSVLDKGNPELSKGIGFTKEETLEVLEYYGLGKYCDLVTAHYDGYRFGREHMYCPWDVMNFCDENRLNVGVNEDDIFAGNYWMNTSGNAVIEEYMGYIRPEHVDQMQTLVNGDSIFTSVRPSLCYGDLKNHDIEDFWTLLLYTGYLTFNPDYKSADADEYELRIPNEEIRKCFEEKVQSFFKGNHVMKNCADDLVKGIFSGDAQTVEQNLNALLAKYVSIRDFATKAPKENYYHGFMNGLLVSSSHIIQEQSSNMESGDGYVDLIISSKTEPKFVLLELKKSGSPTDDRKKIAQSAIKQIKEKMYAEPYISNTTIEDVYAFGICFFNKQCSVVSEKLK